MMHETMDLEKRHAEAGSLVLLARHHFNALFIVVALSAAGALSLYTFTTYMQKFLVNTSGFSIKTASSVMTFAMVIFMMVQPVFGMLSDKIGRRPCLLIFTGLMTLTAVPLLNAIAVVKSPVTAFLLILTALLILSFYMAISGLFKAELFPPHVRALGVSLAHSVAAAIFGGSAEYIALWFKQIGQEPVFYWYVSAICGLAFFVVCRMKEPRRADMMS
ncbi:MAG: MFS transporter, partial [Rhodospirillaceae bacterium]|nr:MFS transporter [Rhodospirillaceae bacterium]